MIFTFLLGALAGAVTPLAEPHVRRALESLALKKIEIETTEFDLLTLIILLLVAALLTGGGSSFALLLGALVGVFAKRLGGAISGKDGA